MGIFSQEEFGDSCTIGPDEAVISKVQLAELQRLAKIGWEHDQNPPVAGPSKEMNDRVSMAMKQFYLAVWAETYGIPQLTKALEFMRGIDDSYYRDEKVESQIEEALKELPK